MSAISCVSYGPAVRRKRSWEARSTVSAFREIIARSSTSTHTSYSKHTNSSVNIMIGGKHTRGSCRRNGVPLSQNLPHNLVTGIQLRQRLNGVNHSPKYHARAQRNQRVMHIMRLDEIPCRLFSEYFAGAIGRWLFSVNTHFYNVTRIEYI